MDDDEYAKMKKKSKDKISAKKLKSNRIDLPFAEVMRRKRKYDIVRETSIAIGTEKTNKKESKKKLIKETKHKDGDNTKDYNGTETTSLNKIEEQIKNLEAELSSQSDDSETSSSEDGDDFSDSDTQSKKKICISSCSSDRIAPLPSKALPNNKRRYLKVDSQSAKRSLDKDKANIPPSENNEHHQGLKKAVHSLLQNYIPRSNERLPFYCRVCNIQSSNIEEFNMHKQTEIHQLAIKEEKKAAYCRICRKQLSSIAQMKEHLQAKPHKEKVDFMVSKTRNSKKFER